MWHVQLLKKNISPPHFGKLLEILMLQLKYISGYYYLLKRLVFTLLKIQFSSSLNREVKEYFTKNTQLPLVAKGRIHSL